jgi:D-alanyl-D-alanine carboxypeptidase
MTGIRKLVAIFVLVSLPFCGFAAPYAAIVIDAKSGKVLHSENENTRLHPAGLTKVSTLYAALAAIEAGEMGLDDKARISLNAANEPMPALGLREGQRVTIRDLIYATAIKGANDTSTALAEAISGSEQSFARRLNQTAQHLGMLRSTFVNAHGLTEKGHLTTAADTAIMMRSLNDDFPDYINLLGTISSRAAYKKIEHSGHRLLKNYKFAEAVKTGHTRAAGFNGVMIAEKRSDRIIVVVFGGKSTKTRNAQMITLAKLGFKSLGN